MIRWYWISEARGNYRCLLCGFQSFDGKPEEHTEACAKRRYELRDNIGKAKYCVSFHDGHKTHSDGSPFWDLKIFSNKRKRDQFVKELVRDGYKERS